MSPEERTDELFDVLPIARDAKAYGEEDTCFDVVKEAIREAERARDQACMAALCEGCAYGDPISQSTHTGRWVHDSGVVCKAQPIREMTDDA